MESFRNFTWDPEGSSHAITISSQNLRSTFTQRQIYPEKRGNCYGNVPITGRCAFTIRVVALPDRGRIKIGVGTKLSSPDVAFNESGYGIGLDEVGNVRRKANNLSNPHPVHFHSRDRIRVDITRYRAPSQTQLGEASVYFTVIREDGSETQI